MSVLVLKPAPHQDEHLRVEILCSLKQSNGEPAGVLLRVVALGNDAIEELATCSRAQSARHSSQVF